MPATQVCTCTPLRHPLFKRERYEYFDLGCTAVVNKRGNGNQRDTGGDTGGGAGMEGGTDATLPRYRPGSYTPHLRTAQNPTEIMRSVINAAIKDKSNFLRSGKSIVILQTATNRSPIRFQTQKFSMLLTSGIAPPN